MSARRVIRIELVTNFTHNYTVLRVGAIQSPCQHLVGGHFEGKRTN